MVYLGHPHPWAGHGREASFAGTGTGFALKPFGIDLNGQLLLHNPDDFSRRYSPHLTLFLHHLCTAFKLKNFAKLHFMYKFSTIIVSDKWSNFNDPQQSAPVEAQYANYVYW